MKQWLRWPMTASVLAVTLGGCGGWEQAAVTITYAAESRSTQWPLDSNSRKGVEGAFSTFAQRNGYKCRPHIKRVEEIHCRGPKGMHLVFQPSVNEAQFVAEFSWVNLPDRTHEEFMQHVAEFTSELGVAVGEANVTLAGAT